MHDYLLALIGGTMIGLAAVTMMATHGKIMGVSGIVSRLLPPVANDWPWRLAFIAGVLVAPPLASVFAIEPSDIVVSNNIVLLVVGGLLVGVGTVTGNGCTSGHGVCGLSRLSVRSLVATGTFMGTAMFTVYLIRHVFTGVAS